MIIAGDLNVVKSSPEYAEMLALTNTIAGGRYPGYPGETLDYVLYRRANAKPASRTNTVLTPQSPPWESGGTTFTDYSDHYPVAG